MTEQNGTTINIKQKEKVLVTGASGFIGSHLVECLLEKGYEVVCLIKPNEDLQWIEDLDVTLYYGDITEKKVLFDSVQGVSYIYHLAARLGGTDKASYIYDVNYGGSKNLIDICIESGVKLKRFLFVSSIAAVGDTGDSEYFNEESTPRPYSDYGKSKLMTEKYLKEKGEKIPYTIVRLPLVYGPRNFHDMYTMFKFVNRRLQLLVGKVSISVGFVKDVVRGMILAAENPVAVGQTYFLGEEGAYSYPKLIQHVAEVLGKKTLKIRIPYFVLYSFAFLCEAFAALTRTYPLLLRRSLDAYLNSNWRFSMKKAKEDLNFEAEYPLPKGLKISAQWYKENGFL